MDIQEFITQAETLAKARKCGIKIDDVAPVYVPDGYAIEEDQWGSKRAIQTFDNGSVVLLNMLLF